MNDKDFKVIQALKEHGSNISKPHGIDFFFDFESFESAATIARSLQEKEFDVKVYENDDGSYTVEARKWMVPELESMQRLTKEFNSLTNIHGGKYDGWGTEIVE